MAAADSGNDIARRKRAEETALQPEEADQDVIDAIPTLAWRAEPDGSVQFFNQRWLEYTGLAFDDARGWGWSAAIHPDDFPHLMAEWREILAAGRNGEFEGRLRRFDGAYRWFLFRAEPSRDRSGNVTNWYGVSIDIQEIKSAEQTLRRSNAYSAEAQRLSRTGSFGRKRGANEVLFWSEEMYRIFGFEPDATLTIEKIIRHVHPDDVPQYRDVLDRMARGEPDVRAQYRLLLPDGTVKYLHVRAHSEVDEAGQPEYVGAVMDVTAAEKAEEALHEAHAALAHVTRVATLGELTASIAHEVNQPLAAIVTNGEASLRWLGREEPQLDEARGAVDGMIGDARRASEVVSRLRALSKKETPRKLPINMNDIIEDSLPLVQRELSLNRVSQKLWLASRLPLVLGDRIQLQQVLINLMINGVHAIAAGTGHRELVIRSTSAADGIVVAVQDSGIGVDPESKDRLFESFFSTKPNGMGMGLSISRSIVESHGGRLWAENNDGPGATFQFFLPLASAVTGLTPEEHSPHSPAGS
jgi:PAS domain S-box-containing protein